MIRKGHGTEYSTVTQVCNPSRSNCRRTELKQHVYYMTCTLRRAAILHTTPVFGLRFGFGLGTSGSMKGIVMY